jgi:hypothetical protein
MPMSVPARRGRGQAQGQPATPPPTVYAMMAATAMHDEGRLLAPDQSGTDAKLNSIPESETTPVRA